MLMTSYSETADAENPTMTRFSLLQKSQEMRFHSFSLKIQTEIRLKRLFAQGLIIKDTNLNQYNV